MDLTSYRDMHLLDLVAQRPDVTQRELSKRIGVALGLTNLMLRRFAKKGYIKIRGTKRSRLRYLITPKGILEKTRLTCEFVQSSLQLYHRVRHFWREQLAAIAHTGQRRIMLFGTGELAEIAFLSIREMGLEFVGVVEETAEPRRFLGYPVQDVYQVPSDSYDWLLVTAWPEGEAVAARLREHGVSTLRIITVPKPGVVSPAPERLDSVEAAATLPVSEDAHPSRAYVEVG